MGLKKKCSVMLSMLMLLPNIAYANDLNSTISLNKEVSLINANSNARVGEERVISAPMLATIATLAVASGITLSSDDDIYDIGRLFYDYVNTHNDLTWEVVKTTFESAKVFNDTILINSGILDVCKGFFDSTFKDTISDVSTILGIPVLNFVSNSNFSKYAHLAMDVYEGVSIGGVDVARVNSEGKLEIGTYYKTNFAQLTNNKMYINGDFIYKYYKTESGSWSFYGNTRLSYLYKDVLTPSVSIPYQGGYDWGSVYDKTENGLHDLPLPIPSNLGDLVGKTSSDVWDKNYENGLVGDGDIVIPAVEGASISVDKSTTFPSEGTYKTPVILNQEATVLDVTVPLSLPVHIDGSGAVTVADNIEIVNNSIAPVKLSSVSIAPKDGWSMVSYDKDFSGSRVGLKEFGFELDGYDLIPNTALTLSDKVVNGGDNLNLIYNANVSPQKEAITDDTVADVVFTIDWD